MTRHAVAWFEVKAIPRFPDYRSELCEQQPENGLALTFGTAQMLSVVVEDGASGAAIEAAPGTVIELMGGDFHQQGKIFWDLAGGLPALIQRRFQVADAFFLRAIVTRITGWIVQGQHAEAGQDRIHLLIIEGRTVVPFEEQRWAVLTKQTFEVGGDLAAIEPVSDQRPEPVARGEVLNGDDLPAVTVFGGVNGPGQSRLEPVDVFHGQQEIPPIILHQRPELTPGQAIGELF